MAATAQPQTGRQTVSPTAGPSGRLVALLAVACGMTVANLYYAQPLLSSLSAFFGIGTAAAGALITTTQIGYVAGMLFLVPLGAAGAAVAPLAGRWADHGLVRPMTAAAFAVAALAFALAAIGRHDVILLAVAAVLIDMTVQTTLILGQHAIYRLDAGARARLNSVYIATFFAGGAFGSQAGSIAYHAYGWTGLTVLGAVLPVLALLYWATEHRATAAP